jgi:DNA polymerase (family 10)
MHTVWSDGRDSIEAMVAQSAALGYEYLAITDHSTHSAALRNLSVEDVVRQADEIAAVRERYPQIAILHGAEVDILRDGRLDFPDRVLREFDIVLASLHDRATHSPDELLHRYAEAMAHPLVSIITHPMNRPGPGRPGYTLDVDHLFELAVETGTVLEVDGAPSHLDLEASLARRAVTAGVLLSVDSDAHRTEMLERHMTLALLTARRGWVQRPDVLNTRSLGDLQKLLAAKRNG